MRMKIPACAILAITPAALLAPKPAKAADQRTETIKRQIQACFAAAPRHIDRSLGMLGYSKAGSVDCVMSAYTGRVDIVINPVKGKPADFTYQIDVDSRVPSSQQGQQTCFDGEKAAECASHPLPFDQKKVMEAVRIAVAKAVPRMPSQYQ